MSFYDNFDTGVIGQFEGKMDNGSSIIGDYYYNLMTLIDIDTLNPNNLDVLVHDNSLVLINYLPDIATFLFDIRFGLFLFIGLYVFFNSIRFFMSIFGRL